MEKEMLILYYTDRYNFNTPCYILRQSSIYEILFINYL